MKPIGYWLNRADHAFTTHMDTMLTEFGLTRITWQVLNVVADTPDATDTDIHTVLAANAARATLDAAIATTFTGDWTTRPGPDRIALTDRGRLPATGGIVALIVANESPSGGGVEGVVDESDCASGGLYGTPDNAGRGM